MQAVLLIIVFQTSLVIQNKCMPYFKPENNNLEQMTLISSNFLLLAGLVAFVAEFTSELFLTILSIIIISVIFITGFIMFGSIIYNFGLAILEANRRGLKKVAVSLNNLSPSLGHTIGKVTRTMQKSLERLAAGDPGKPGFSAIISPVASTELMVNEKSRALDDANETIALLNQREEKHLNVFYDLYQELADALKTVARYENAVQMAKNKRANATVESDKQ